jgi:subfamily B ATP-binding cassette protein MsbA
MKSDSSMKIAEERMTVKRANEKEGKALLSRTLAFMFRYWPALALTFLITVVVSTLAIARPWIQKLLIDNITLGGSTDSLLKVVGLLLGVAVLQVACRIAQRFLFARIQESTARDLRETIADWLFSLKMPCLKGKDTGSIISTVLQDVEKMSDLYGPVIIGLASDMLQFIAIICIMLYISIELTALTIPLYVLMMYIMKDATKPIQKASSFVQDAKAKVSSSLKEFWSSLPETRSLNGKEYVMGALSNSFNCLKSKEIHMETIQAFFQSVDLFVWMIAAAMLWVGGKRVISGTMTMGDLIAFWGYMALILGPINHFINSLGIGRASLGAAERVFSILDEGEPEEIDNDNMVEFPRDYSSLTFDNVTFRYEDAEDLLAAFHCTVKRGEKVALMGKSGSGKTTIASLLISLFTTVEGQILIGDTPIERIGLRSLRENIGLVFQNPHMFVGTIEENISIAKPGASLFQVEHAAAKAEVLEFTDTLAEGLQTRIGDGGRELSGGQKQRIALARLFLKHPSIAIIDESTSALDTVLEQRIIKNLLNELIDTTVIAISHKESLVRLFDRVIRL